MMQANEDRTEDVYFRHLFEAIQDYEGRRLVEDVLIPWLPRAEQAVRDLEFFRRIEPARHLGEDDLDDAWQWYALSRVNDLLLNGFAAPHIRGKWYGAGGDRLGEGVEPRWHERRVRWIQETLSIDKGDYTGWLECQGFTTFRPDTYHPFYCEIVHAEAAACSDQQPEIEEVYWPGVMFGDMLFSRSGVRISVGKDAMSAGLAERSCMYFTYWRIGRPTADQSHGWGSNARWRTSFRFDYQCAEGWAYNVGHDPFHLELEYKTGCTGDGCEYKLFKQYKHLVGKRPAAENDAINVSARIEQLLNRCRVTPWIPDSTDDWPYYDTCFEPIARGGSACGF